MILQFLNIVFMTFAVVLLVPTCVFCIECVAAMLPKRRIAAATDAPRPRVAVLMPAYNEEFGIDAALQSVLPQLRDGDRFIVIADNCTDATSNVVRSRGVEVIDRNNPEQRGKGFALDYGLTHLESNPPEIVIFMDSDCVLHDGSIDALAWQASRNQRAAQAIYLLTRPVDSSPRDAVSSLAFLVKNLVRPRGLDRLGLPCLLTGAGMAVPWQQARAMRIASGNIVEDLQLGIDLTLAGHAPRLCTGAFVTGELPRQRQAAAGQRKRWEHGYVQTAVRTVPLLAVEGIKRANVDLLGIALELSVPPLVLLLVMLALATGVSGTAAFFGTTLIVPVVMAGGLLTVLACIAAGWFRFGRSRVPVAALLGCPSYLLSKLPLYASFAFERETKWIRTARADEVQQGKSDASVSATDRLPSIVLQGIRFSRVNEKQCVDYVLEELQEGRGGVLVTPNLDHLRRCRRDPAFAGLVGQAQVVVADGMPLVWASRLQRTPLPQRVAGSDLISSISAAAAVKDRSVFLLGGAPCAADRAAQVLLERHPNLRISGTHCPPLGFENNPEALAEIIDRITATRPDIIYVALGSPKQEQLIHELRDWLPKSWWFGVGYSFSFLAGDGRRAPRWMQQLGLEWMHRLLCEPRRLAKRYLVEGMPHAARLLAETTVNGLTRRTLNVSPQSTVPTPPTIQQHRLGSSPDHGQLAALISSSLPRGLGVELSRLSHRQESSTPNTAKMRVDSRRGRLQAFVLLGGTLRPTPFFTAINRSILDMPIQDGRRLLSNWQHQTSELAKLEGLDQLAMRVLVDHDSHLPAAAQPNGGCSVSIERDAARYRGTGGLLRDLAESYDDQDFLLVANGAQLLTQPLVDLVRQLHDTEADVSFVAHQDGTPSSLMLVRCETLRAISRTGYVDMKEQALPMIARQFQVTHVDQARSTSLSLRSHRDYLAALRWLHFQRSFQSSGDGRPQPESQRDQSISRFSIVEHGAIVHSTACLQDCVVLRGARIEAGAVAVRSVFCAGSVLRADDTAVDELVTVRSSSATARTQRVPQLLRI